MKTACDTLDKAGAVASFACAIHCALMPVVVSVLPLLGLAFLADERVEFLLVGSSAVVGVTSISLGFRMHRRWITLIVLAIGLLLLVTGRIGEHLGVGAIGAVAVVLGGISVASSHILNRWHIHRWRCGACVLDKERQQCGAAGAGPVTDDLRASARQVVEQATDWLVGPAEVMDKSFDTAP